MTFIQVIYKQSQVGSLFTLIPGMEFISQRIIARIKSKNASILRQHLILNVSGGVSRIFGFV